MSTITAKTNSIKAQLAKAGYESPETGFSGEALRYRNEGRIAIVGVNGDGDYEITLIPAAGSDSVARTIWAETAAEATRVVARWLH